LWKSAVARYATSARYDFLFSFAETENQLEQLLRTPIPDAHARGQNLDLEAVAQSKPVASQIAALKSINQKLLLLSASAHPLLRPVVLEYRGIALTLASGKRTRVAKRLAAVKSTHLQMVRRMTVMDDYLNWFEATQLQTSSGDFTNYLKAAGASEEAEERRRDALSVYLDAVEAQFQN
jgi:xanthine dehydrogenase molybdopterin-binding subunit B